MNRDLLQGFYLGDRLVDPLRGKVTGREGSSHLPPKAAEVLLCLASNPGELVTRETLIAEVWGNKQVSREALNHAISDIRQALDDRYENPRFVQTLPRRGYRLIVTPELPRDIDSSIMVTADPGNYAAEIGLLENLKQRGVLETGLAYLVVGWLLLQVVDVVFDQLHMPTWAGTFVTVLVIAGFPISLVLSWFLEFHDGRAVVDHLSPRDARRRRFGRTYLSVVAALAIAGICVIIYDESIGLPDPRDPVEGIVEEEPFLPPVMGNSIAVLPFFNIDGSDTTEIFANGLVDDVINRLSRVPGLRVSSRGDSYTLKANSASQKVRERLRVALYVEGSVQSSADQLRIMVQLIDSATGFHIFSRTFDRPREDFFRVRDEITELAVANVRVALPADTQAATKFVVDDDPNLDVYLLYRRGVQLSRHPSSVDTIESALSWFDQALQLDPDYAAAHAGKCAVYVNGYPETDDPAYIRYAEQACARALELNPNLDIVHTALGELYRATGRYEEAEAAYLQALQIDSNSVASLIGLGTTYMGQQRNEDAEGSFRRAIGLHPGDWSAYNALGFFLYHAGRYQDAIEQYQYVVALDNRNIRGYSNLGAAHMLTGNFEAAAQAYQRAIEIEPRPTAFSNLGLMHYYLGQYSLAIEVHQRAAELAPNDHLILSNLGDALWVSGQRGEARQAFEAAEGFAVGALEINPNDSNNIADLAWIKAMLDHQTEAISLIERALRLAPEDPYFRYIEGLIQLRGGHEDAAIEALEVAVEKGYSVGMLTADPLLGSLRDKPRFQTLVEVAHL